jgi:hypothetical protein
MLSMLVFAAATAELPRVEVLPTVEPAQSSFRCEGQGGVQTVEDRARTPVKLQKLNELPNANAYKAVIRVDEYGCRKPLIVAYDIGSAPRKQR